MKKIAVGILVILTFGFIQPTTVNAADGHAVAIVDSYFDMSKINFPVTVICVAEDKCATQPVSSTTDKNYFHGAIMANTVIKQNPNAKIILIRSASISSNKTVNFIKVSEFDRALKWVLNNNNIAAVSFSYSLTGNGCQPNSSLASPMSVSVADALIRSDINALATKNIPLIAAAGNNGSRTQIDYPACIPNAVAVSTRTYDTNGTAFMSKNTNYSDSLTDFVFGPNGGTGYNGATQYSSSSEATAGFAAYWTKKYDGNMSNTYALIKNNSVNVYDAVSSTTWNKYSAVAANIIP